jgi:hypothetical protein
MKRSLQKGRQWWALQPVRELPAPSYVEGPGATRTKLDHFVLAKLQENGLTPSEEADPRTLVRRAHVDLIGLKPTYEEVEAFANDPSPNRYETLVCGNGLPRRDEGAGVGARRTDRRRTRKAA